MLHFLTFFLVSFCFLFLFPRSISLTYSLCFHQQQVLYTHPEIVWNERISRFSTICCIFHFICAINTGRWFFIFCCTWRLNSALWWGFLRFLFLRAFAFLQFIILCVPHLLQKDISFSFSKKIYFLLFLSFLTTIWVHL
jgi:hypothetical protein